jgi:hypothetical protein
MTLQVIKFIEVRVIASHAPRGEANPIIWQNANLENLFFLAPLRLTLSLPKGTPSCTKKSSPALLLFYKPPTLEILILTKD